MSNKNQYKQATKYFGIPVPGWKDGIWPELELLKWQMIENLLLAAMRGAVNAIFREGNMAIRQDADGSYSVRLTAASNEPSCQGSVGGAYFDAPSAIMWSGLQAGQSYYLYIKGSIKTFHDASDVTTVASPTRLVTRYVTLVAKADLMTEKPTLDRNPPGKVNARDLAQHVLDYANPHGEKLTQDELLVGNRLAIGDGNDASLEFDVNGQVTAMPLSKFVAVLTSTRTFTDFVSGGINGVTLTATGKVVYASVVRTKPEDREAGEVVVGFHGLHPAVKSANQIIVWNSGAEGVAMRAMLICE